MFTSLRSRLFLVALVAFLPLLAFFVHTQAQLRGVLEEGLVREALISVRSSIEHHRTLLAETETILGLLGDFTARLGEGVCPPDLSSILERSDYLHVLAVADTAGDLVCVAPAAQEGVNIADRDYFRAALAADAPVAGYHTGRVTGEPSLAMAYPITGPGGEPFFLIGGVSLEGVDFLPLGGDLAAGRHFVLFERDGTILHRAPDPAPSGASVEAPLLPRDGEGGAGRDAADSGEPWTVRTVDSDGSSVVFAVAPLVQRGGTADAYLAMGFESALARAAGRDVLVTNLVGLALALLLLTLGIWAVLEYAFLRRLGPILDTSRELAAGDLGARTGITDGRDEVTRLARTIDTMAASLEELRRREASQARAELEESERRFRQLAENIRDIFWLYDLEERRVVYVSPAFDEITGRDPAWIRQGSDGWLSMIHPADRERAREFFDAAFTERSEVEYRILRPDGDVRWLRDTASPVRDPRGETVRVAGLAQDVTEEKEMEEALRRASKLEAVGRLAGGVAHDFNNILTAIGANTQLLMGDLGPESPLREELAEIDRGVNRAASLTGQLLAFSRQQALRLRVLDPGRLVEGLRSMLGRLLGEGIAVVVETDPGVGPIRVDPNQLEHALVNLAVNARDAMPDGGTLTLRTRAVEVESEERMQPGRYARIEVEDTGVGIPEDEIDRIFEPFWTTKEPGKGTGLGLASAYGIVRQSGGYLWVRSEVGRGSVFSIYFPESDLPAEERPEAAEPIPAEGDEDRPGTILVVEDEEGVRQVAKRSLERYGYSVLAASSGEEGLSILEERGDVDLVLCDVVMAGLGGREVRDRVERMRPGLPVILMSGYPVDPTGRPEPVDDTGAPFLRKPFTPGELAERVEEVLGRRRRGGGNGEPPPRAGPRS